MCSIIVVSNFRMLWQLCHYLNQCVLWTFYGRYKCLSFKKCLQIFHIFSANSENRNFTMEKMFCCGQPNDTLIVILHRTGPGPVQGMGLVQQETFHSILHFLFDPCTVQKNRTELNYSSWTVKANVQGFEIIIDEIVALQKFYINLISFLSYSSAYIRV